MRVYLYDSFSELPFSGNVGGVVTDASGLSTEEMQRIARELGAPTTGFVVGFERGKPPIFDVRYFTPSCEIDVCGHVTVAVFTALAAEDRCASRPGGAPLRVRCRAGLLTVVVDEEADGSIVVEMGQRTPAFETRESDAAEARRALGGVPLHRSLPVEIASTGLRHLVVPFAEPADLARLEPDACAVARLCRAAGADTLAAAAPPREAGAPIRLRDFCAAIGAVEEPASGTTAAAVAAYFARHGVVACERDDVVHAAVEQGVEMGRPSRIQVRLGVIGGVVRHASVRGAAVRVMCGDLSFV
jgi:trans-2,3-dihydro-3-hydroxyanthranilate isomerase